MPPAIKDAVILGSGNVAFHMAIALHDSGVKILQVCGRNSNEAKKIARRVGAKSTDSFSEINPEAQLYIIAVKDESISEIVDWFPEELEGIIVHTSGSVPLSKLKTFKNHGVIYPLQTLIKYKEAKYSDIPFCIEGSSKNAEKILAATCKKISGRVYTVDSGQRKKLHLAAVFANNFSNHMFAIAENILKENALEFEMLVPLIRQTVENAKTGDIVQLQTGPARRNDANIMKEHQRMLKEKPLINKIYKLVSESISKTARKNGKF